MAQGRRIISKHKVLSVGSKIETQNICKSFYLIDLTNKNVLCWHVHTLMCMYQSRQACEFLLSLGGANKIILSNRMALIATLWKIVFFLPFGQNMNKFTKIHWKLFLTRSYKICVVQK